VHLGTHDGEAARFPVAALKHQPDNAGQEEEVLHPFDPDRRPVPRVARNTPLLPLFPVVVAVHHVEDREEDGADKEHVREDGLRDPEERHVVQEAQKQGGVSQRGQRPADVGHEKDEEDDDMGLSLPVAVRLHDRPDHDHGGPRRAHPGGEECPDQQQDSIDERCSAQRSGDDNPAGDGKEPPEKDNEGDVVDEVDVDDREDSHLAIDINGGHREGDRPEGRHLAVMMVPEFRSEQGAQGDGQEDPREGDHGPEGKDRAKPRVRGIRACSGGQRVQEGRKQTEAGIRQQFQWVDHRISSFFSGTNWRLYTGYTKNKRAG